MDDDSAQMETGMVTLQYKRSGGTGAISVASRDPFIYTPQVVGEALSVTYSFIFAVATSRLYVCVTVDTPTGNDINTYQNIGLNPTIVTTGGRFTSFLQH
jgi:hypothetical protein